MNSLKIEQNQDETVVEKPNSCKPFDKSNDISKDEINEKKIE
jgi:hypothetical protein